MTLTLRHAVRSDVGHVRDNNEDAGYASAHLVAVADGMGGGPAGEVASKLAIARLVALDESGVGPDPAGALQAAVLAANQDLHDFVAADPELDGMGTTVTALLAGGEVLALIHVGDSRAYLFRDGRLSQLTTDHTLVQSLVDSGQISADEAAVHPQRSVITRVLIGQPGVELDQSLLTARVGDRYLVCSDGLPIVVTDETIADALRLGDPEAAAQRLVDLALRGGGPDNVTVAVADVVEQGPQPLGVADEAVIAGAAAEGPEPLRFAATSAAARAAELVGQPGRLRSRADQRAAGVPVDPRSRARRVFSAVALPLLALLVIAGGVAGTWIYIRHQYYVGVSGSRVAVFRGIAGNIGPIHLSQVENLAMPLALLDPVFQQRVRAGIDAKNLAAAEQIVRTLEQVGERPAPAPSRHPVTRTARARASSSPTTRASGTTG